MCNLSVFGLVRGKFPELFAHAQTVDTRPLFPPTMWPGYEASLFTAVFSQLSIFTTDYLRHPIQMVGVETIWELHTLSVIYSWYYPLKWWGQFAPVDTRPLSFSHGAWNPGLVLTPPSHEEKWSGEPS